MTIQERLRGGAAECDKHPAATALASLMREAAHELDRVLAEARALRTTPPRYPMSQASVDALAREQRRTTLLLEMARAIGRLPDANPHDVFIGGRDGGRRDPSNLDRAIAAVEQDVR